MLYHIGIDIALFTGTDLILEAVHQMNNKRVKGVYKPWLLLLLIGIGFSLAAGEAVAAKPKLTLNKVSWSAKSHQLVVKGKLKNSPAGTAVDVFDLDGRRLGTANASPFNLNIDTHSLVFVPCNVRVQAGNLEVIKAVAGNTNKACKLAPKCQITAPASAVSVKVNEPVTFTGKAIFKKQKGKPTPQPNYEWDFSGGSMGEDDAKNAAVDSHKRATGTSATVKFIRDNSRYLVHFSAVDGSVQAMESRQYRCEDSVEVTVGNPPTDVPDMTAMVKAAQDGAPKLGSELDGKKGDLVVLPYEDLTLQCTEDARTAPGSYLPGEFRYGSLNAVVYQKDLKPPQRTDLTLRYSAASNPNDPAGAGSINSTSQNWPLNADIRAAGSPWMEARIDKTDRWDSSLMGSDRWNIDQIITALRFDIPITPDQGITILDDPNNAFSFPSSLTKPAFDSEHGRFMPGFDNPYVANQPQEFTGYLNEFSAYEARLLPLTDIDDTGRVNPFPLLRIQAFDSKDSTTPLTTTDAVQTAGRDFHCRECHAKGKIGAANHTWTPAAYGYSVWNADTNTWGGSQKEFKAPPFLEPVGPDGQSSTDVRDQELAALANIWNIHSFYDFPEVYVDDITHWVEPAGTEACGEHCHNNNSKQHLGFPDVGNGADPENIYDPEAPAPMPASAESEPMYYELNYSMNMHRWHGQLQYNDNRDGILRDARGVPQRWSAASHPAGETNTRSLFPVKDAQGNILPMEQNCLKCHAGQREQCYRDRMYTAGVTCYQCHGDMLAVAKEYPKKYVNSDGHRLRSDSFDQPDCGSCHVGTANLGKSAGSGFFSAGVRMLAFDDDDRSATTRPVDWSNPDAGRFAIPPTLDEIQQMSFYLNQRTGVSGFAVDNITRRDGPLYRSGKDTHGNVPCGACHGGAHAVWPNRNPNANDNVTALQLQGHTGTILECNVCHDKDAFKVETDLDGSDVYSHDPKPGILGGPHNIHPINDPYWWKSTEGDTPNADGTTYGGWHNNYAKKPGKANEDQCAACHGNDHQGTRLSRTPVDRTFDFSGMSISKLKKAGVKKKVVKVLAGTPIGCDTCHSIKTSCISSPAGDQCGKESANTTPSTNKPPVFTAEPGAQATTYVYGESGVYSYTPVASDPDGDSLTYGLSTRLDPMTIDAQTGKVFSPHWNSVSDALGLPYTFTYIVTINDGKGGFASQQVPVLIRCPDGKAWGYDATKEAKSCIVNQAPTMDASTEPKPPAVVGEKYRYVPFTGNDSDQQVLNYTLSGQPGGLTIGRTNGAVNGTLTEAGTFILAIGVVDQAGATASQDFTLHVCPSGQTWLESAGNCVANHSPSIGSKAPTGAAVGMVFSYMPSASDADGDPLSYSLSAAAPAGMTINPATGAIAWTPTEDDGTTGYFAFTVYVQDGKGGLASQDLALGICAVGQQWHEDHGMCM